ncbi:AzlD domain-containing protein [Lonsdalea quercina]|uniref:Branched-chain amino acid transport protein n=1 Tax=Lonsdalea quercina TaxID=71657 RepID=A0A1H3XWM2_9GAMM|nr:AzlD domain-containing protein [Lonsdalea quercina]SEA03857.1 Branched-chain amino acid transport protein [Lonsdalea quercina]
MNNSYFIALTLGMAAVTFLIRFSFIGIAGKLNMSERVKKTLRFVPATVLPAIITVQILEINSHMQFDLQNPKVIAAIICTLISFRFGLIWVVISGVGSLLLLSHFM